MAAGNAPSGPFPSALILLTCQAHYHFVLYPASALYNPSSTQSLPVDSLAPQDRFQCHPPRALSRPPRDHASEYSRDQTSAAFPNSTNHIQPESSQPRKSTNLVLTVSPPAAPLPGRVPSGLPQVPLGRALPGSAPSSSAGHSLVQAAEGLRAFILQLLDPPHQRGDRGVSLWRRGAMKPEPRAHPAALPSRARAHPRPRGLCRPGGVRSSRHLHRGGEHD